jgi:hypothetical protein
MPYTVDISIDSTTPGLGKRADYYKRFDLKKLSLEEALPLMNSHQKYDFKASETERILEKHKPKYEVFDEFYPTPASAKCTEELCLEPYETSILSMCLR